MLQLTFIQKLIALSIPLLFAITVHEVAHGWVASKLGDKTALMLGRLTLNPFKHIDLFGTILLPLILFFVGGGNFIFGWAKPVPINYTNLHHPRRDLAFIALAGPLSNLVMAIIWAVLAKLGAVLLLHGVTYFKLLLYMGQTGILVNLVLMVLNLIPIPPLDGSRIVSSLLPVKLAYHYNRIAPFGFFILLVLLVTHVIDAIVGPSVSFLYTLLVMLFAL